MIGKSFTKVLPGILALLFIPLSARAQVSASHTVHVGIQPITVLAVSGDPQPLLIASETNAASRGASDGSSFYNLTTNMNDVVVEARLEHAMPEGSQLWLTGETTLGTSQGRVQLIPGQPVSIATNLIRGLENGRVLRYEWIVSDGVGEVPVQSRTVTLSLVDRQSGGRSDVAQTVTFGHVGYPGME